MTLGGDMLHLLTTYRKRRPEKNADDPSIEKEDHFSSFENQFFEQ